MSGCFDSNNSNDEIFIAKMTELFNKLHDSKSESDKLKSFFEEMKNEIAELNKRVKYLEDVHIEEVKNKIKCQLCKGHKVIIQETYGCAIRHICPLCKGKGSY